jgi:hypothetical protein
MRLVLRERGAWHARWIRFLADWATGLSLYIYRCGLYRHQQYRRSARSINANAVHNTVILNPRQTSTDLVPPLARKGGGGVQSLSEPLPVGPSSSSSWTTSLPICIPYSAFLRAVLRSSFRGSTSSNGRSFALFRILHSILALDHGRLFIPSADLGSHPASNRISTIS